MQTTRVRTVVRVLAAASFAVLVVGCSSRDKSLSHGARFDGDAAAGNGLVLVGVRVVREPVRRNWLVGDVRLRPVYYVTLSDLTQDGRLGRTYRTMRFCEETRILLGGVLSDCDPHVLQYKMVSVPAGRYTLESFSYEVDRLHVTSSYVATQTPRGAIALVSAGDPVRNPAASFDVRPGEIVYIGNLSFDFAPRVASARMSASRNDDDARRAVASYPNVRGSLVFRPVAGEGMAVIDAAGGPVPNVLTQ